MAIEDDLRTSIHALYQDSDHSSDARTYYLASLLAVDAWEQTSKISCLAEARANINKLAERKKAADTDYDPLAGIVKR